MTIGSMIARTLAVGALFLMMLFASGGEGLASETTSILELDSLHSYIESLPPCGSHNSTKDIEFMECLMQVEDGYQRCAGDRHLCVCNSLREVKSRCYAGCPAESNSKFQDELSTAVDGICQTMHHAAGVVYAAAADTGDGPLSVRLASVSEDDAADGEGDGTIEAIGINARSHSRSEERPDSLSDDYNYVDDDYLYEEEEQEKTKYGVEVPERVVGGPKPLEPEPEPESGDGDGDDDGCEKGNSGSLCEGDIPGLNKHGAGSKQSHDRSVRQSKTWADAKYREDRKLHRSKKLERVRDGLDELIEQERDNDNWPLDGYSSGLESDGDSSGSDADTYDIGKIEDELRHSDPRASDLEEEEEDDDDGDGEGEGENLYDRRIEDRVKSQVQSRLRAIESQDSGRANHHNYDDLGPPIYEGLDQENLALMQCTPHATVTKTETVTGMSAALEYAYQFTVNTTTEVNGTEVATKLTYVGFIVREPSATGEPGTGTTAAYPAFLAPKTATLTATTTTTTTTTASGVKRAYEGSVSNSSSDTSEPKLKALNQIPLRMSPDAPKTRVVTVTAGDPRSGTSSYGGASKRNARVVVFFSLLLVVLSLVLLC